MIMVEDAIDRAAGEDGEMTKPKWTIMVYLAGDNSLTASSIAILQELEAADVPPEDVRVLACFDSNTPRPKGSRYLEINCRRLEANNGMNWGLHNDMVSPEERDPSHTVFAPDFCNPTVAIEPAVIAAEATLGLDRFLEWALREHKAENYMLILFGHGTAVAGKTFLTDDNPPSFVRLKDFRDLLEKHFSAQKLNILACNNCVMNGIETAFEVKDHVDYIIGSQGLVLTVGWPYRKMIEAVKDEPTADANSVVMKMLKACARNLLDFSLMDRSSEQAICDLTRLDGETGLLHAIRELSKKLQECLRPEEDGSIHCPQIRDAVRLARLEAQSFWDEMFTDIFDFCELLLDNCREYIASSERLMESLELEGDIATSAQEKRADLETLSLFKDVAECCLGVLRSFPGVIPHSYYIGSDLQYSHGLSVFFPWTLPEAPFFFKAVSDDTRDFLILTAFDEYETYGFAKPENCDWSGFLRAFFKATLRDVRRFDRSYTTDESFDIRDFKLKEEGLPLPVNLQKSGMETSKEGADCTCPTIKNYPRRNYLSPADCRRRHVPGVNAVQRPGSDEVSYLGWSLRGIVADVIDPANVVVRPSSHGTGSSSSTPYNQEE